MFGNNPDIAAGANAALKAPAPPANPPMFGSAMTKPKRKKMGNTYLGENAEASPFQLAETTLMGGGS